MKKACILTIGSEIVEGFIVDENSAYLSKRLLELGYRVIRIVYVDDVFEDVEKEMKRSLKECDLVVTTGGLGPTEDDITREAASRTTGRELIFDENLFEKISQKVREFAGKVVESVKREAMVLSGAEIIWNDVGSAPGQLLRIDGKILVILPGPPPEMRNVFEKVAEGIRAGEGYFVKVLKFFGVRESILEDELREILYSNPNVKVATQASYTRGVWIRFTAPAKFKGDVLGIVGRVKSIRGEDVYAEDDETMEERIVKMLKESKVSLAVAESCSGGMLSSKLVNVPGVSEVFRGGIIAYENSVKMNVLGVKEETLRKYGAVSEECVREMSEGVKSLLNSDIAVSISGIAGPTGGSPEKPVGLVYIDLYDGNHKTKSGVFRGGRNTIRERATMEALDLIRRTIGGMKA